MSDDTAKRTVVSRRALIGAATAAPVLANAGDASAADDLVVRYASCVAIDIRAGRMVRRWGDLESEAFALPGWFDLSKEEQLALPQGREMAEIDGILSSLFEQREKHLAELPKVAATDPTGVAAKIAVAARVVDPEDHEEAITSSLARPVIWPTGSPWAARGPNNSCWSSTPMLR